MRKKLSILLLILLLNGKVLFSYAFNPWGGITGKNVMGITPFLYFTDDFKSISSDFFINYGWSEKGDIFVDVLPLSIAPSFGYGIITVMPRYEVWSDIIFAVPLYINVHDGSVSGDVALHYNKFLNEKIQFQFNGGYSIPTHGGKGSVYSFAALDYYVDNYLGFYVEIDPSYDFDVSIFDVGIVPGIYIAFDKDQKHSVSIGFLNSFSSGEFEFYGIGMWYYTFFEL